MGTERQTAKETWLTLRKPSSGALTSSSSESCDPRLATRLAAQLFGCYRASEANDPETFITSAVANLASYPECVVERICDPVRGLPAKSKWLPSIAEIRAACETEMVWRDTVERRDRVREATLAGRREGHKAPVGSPEHGRVVGRFSELRGELTPADPTPEARAMRLEELGAAYVRTPPTVSTQVMEKYLNGMRAPSVYDDEESFDDDRELLP
jgi:hypothetical protein